VETIKQSPPNYFERWLTHEIIPITIAVSMFVLMFIEQSIIKGNDFFGGGDFFAYAFVICLPMVLPFFGAICRTKRGFFLLGLIAGALPAIWLFIMIQLDPWAGFGIILVLPLIIVSEFVVFLQYIVNNFAERYDWYLSEYWYWLVLIGLIVPIGFSLFLIF
jgi:hypothetical protein